ncbi:hypothetical protein KXS11_01780 [Plantibacter flavus]|uniref:hypothetical protein n=1 Tax=Plantibacter flavus TaxID=150123 RepID=UPI003F145DC3
MEQSADSTGFPLWRAIAIGGFAAAAFTAIALFGSPASAHADDDAATDPSLLGAVTQVVGSLEQPLDAVADVVDAVDTTVVEPVVSVVDDTVAAVPVVNDVVDQTLGEAPVAAIVEPVVDTVDQTITGAGDVLGGVAVPAVPGVDPTVPVSPETPALPGPADGSVESPSVATSGPLVSGPATSVTDTERTDGYAAFLAGRVVGAPSSAASTTPPPEQPSAPQLPQNDPAWAVAPTGSGSSASGAAAGGPGVASDAGVDTVIPALRDDRRGPARDDDLPASPTFPSDTSPD